MAEPLAAKAGMRLSAWRPIRLLKNGAEVVLKIPPQRGLKYLSAQFAQAGVGVVGFQKMEEHLASRRPAVHHSGPLQKLESLLACGELRRTRIPSRSRIILNESQDVTRSF